MVDTDDKHAIRNAHRQAREEHKLAQAKQNNATARPDTFSSDEEDLMPSLRYGTINEPLHPDFHTQDLPHLGNFYVGNMAYMTVDAPFFPASLPSDGKMDMLVINGDIPRTTALRMVTTVDQGSLLSSATRLARYPSYQQ